MKNCTRPVIVSPSASGMPLKGTCTTSIPAMERNISPAKCVPLPTHAEEKLSCPGFAFAAATRSETLLIPRDGGATRTYFDVAVSVTPKYVLVAQIGRAHV